MADSLSGLLGQIAGEFADRQQRGETPSIEEYAARFPDIATVLREVLPLLVAVPSTHITAATPGSGEPPPAVPNYEILGELGRGGMGVVYKAQQAGLGRTVALKMILAGVRASAEERARFLAEAEAIAQVRHPGIVAVHDFGTHDGAPFFSLEFCEGGSLAERLSGTPLLPGVAAQLVEQLAGAMQAAHNAGIVHRDLKPANVLLATAPQAGAEWWTVAAKISDFGLARFQHRDTGLTATGAIVGTPSYMAPEQARGASRHVGPAADVYALGAILYECLTGRPPFKAASLYDTLLQVAEQEPVPPRQLNPQIPVDLESIALTCLHKDPVRRYPTAQALSEDLARFREGRPTWARPVGSWERGVKWARRRPALATLSAALVVGGLIALTVVTWLWQKAEAASDAATQSANGEKLARLDAEAAEQEARDTAQREALAKVQAREAEGLANRTLYLRNIAQANAQWQAGNARLGEVLLNECPVHLRGWEWRYLWAMVRSLDRDVLDHDIVARTALAANSRGDRLATAASTRVMLHAADGQTLRTWNTPGKTRTLAFCPMGKYLAAAPLERNWFSQVKVWDVGGKQVASLSGAACVAFRPDGLVVAHGSGQTIQLHDTTNWRSLASLRGHSGNVLALHFSATGNFLASGDDAGQVIFWQRLATGNPGAVVGQIALPALGNLLGAAVSLAPLEYPLARIAAHKGSVETVALDPTGRYLATGGMDQVIRVWSVPGGNRIATLTGHPGRVWSLVWSPSGTRLFSGGHDGTIREWDPLVGRQVRVLAGHDAAVSGVAFLGERLVSTGLDGTLRRWDDGDGVCRSYLGHAKAVNCVAFHLDGKRAASGGEDKSVRLWDLERRTSQVLDSHGQACVRVLFDEQGKYLASVALDGVVHLWDVATTRRLHRWQGQSGFTQSLAFDPRGRWLASGHGKGQVLMWDCVSGNKIATWEMPRGTMMVAGLVFDHAGDRLTAMNEFGQLRTWDTANKREIRTTRRETMMSLSLGLSPDGKTLATGSTGVDQTGLVRLWDAEHGTLRRTLAGHFGPVAAVDFHPDGKTLASASWDGTARLWNPQQGEELLQLPRREGAIYSVAFDRAGKQMLCGGLDGVVRLYAPQDELPRFVLRQSDLFLGVAVDPAGDLLATCDTADGVRLWNLATGKLRLGWHSDTTVWSLAFQPDAPHLAGACQDGSVRVWHKITGAEVAKWAAHGKPARAIASDQHGDLASGGDDGRIRFWRLGSPSAMAELKGHTARVSGIAISGDGNLLVSASHDGSVRLWDRTTGKERWRNGGAAAFEAVAIHPRAETVAAVSADGMLHLWDLESGKSVLSTRAHTGSATAIVFRADGTRLVTGGEDRVAHIWDVRSEKRLQTLTGHTLDLSGVAFGTDQETVVTISHDRTLRIWSVPR